MTSKMGALSITGTENEIKHKGCFPNPTLLFRNCCKALPIFHPYGPIRLCWDAFIMMALIYTAFEIPLTLAFELTLTLNDKLGIAAFCIDILLLIDICINFRTQHYDKWDRLLLHTDPFDIAKKYVKGWFWLDLLTSFPFEFIVDAEGIKNSNWSAYLKVLRIFRLFRIFKMLRVIRVIKMFDGLTKMMDLAREMFFIFRLCKILGGMILTAHYFACIWWHVGLSGYKEDIAPSTNDDGITSYSSWIQAQGIDIDDSLVVKYSASWYWAVVTLFTTGYGDITAHNVVEQWVCSMCILTGSCLFAYFIGTLTTWVAEGDRVRSFEMQKVEEAQAFCRHHKFDRTLTRTILSHVRYYCNYNFVFEAEDILPLLPPFLQRRVNRQIAERFLSKMDLFQNLPQEIIGQIALTMHSISCNAEQYLFKHGDVAKCMYLQRTGEAKLRYLDGTHPRTLKRGDVIGERALILGKRRYDVLCERWSEFFVLHVDNIKDIFRRSFKPKRFKHEWNLMKKKVKISYTGHTKSQRRCNLTINDKSGVSRKMVHDLSVRGKTLRSEIIEKFIFSPRKNNIEAYQKVSQEDDSVLGAESTILPAHAYTKSSILDIDDIDVSKPFAGYSSEFSSNKQQDVSRKSASKTPRAQSCMINHTNNQETEKFRKRSGSSSFFAMPWIARHNSERRNEKVKHHTQQTAFGKKKTEISSRKIISPENNSFKFVSSNYSDEELDMDDSTDDSDDILAPLTSNQSVHRRSMISSHGVMKSMNKFGHNKKINISKKRLKIHSPPSHIPKKSSKMKSIRVTNELEILEDPKSDSEKKGQWKDENDIVSRRDTILLDQEQEETSANKITQSVIRNCSYEKANKVGSYEMTHSGSSSGSATDEEGLNNKNDARDSKQT